jgi:hypothetical protein
MILASYRLFFDHDVGNNLHYNIHMSYRKNATGFVWDILKSDFKLLAYPLCSIVAMIVLLIVMSPLIFDMSALKIADTLSGVYTDELGTIQTTLQQEPTPQLQAQNTAQNAQDWFDGKSGISNIFGHMNFLWLFCFLIINSIIGVLNIGALTAQALAMSRGEKKPFIYGYGMALTRLPQLILWSILSLIVGSIFQIIEQQKAIGLLVGLLLGVGWSVLTFFSITGIMATGCGPFAAISKSKNTIKDTYKKITGEEPVSLKSLKRGLYIGGPLAFVNLFVIIAMVVLIFTDMRGLLLGSHAVTIGAFIALLAVMLIASAFRAALWAILKTTVYVWAEEDALNPTIDSAILKHAFVIPSAHRHSKSPVVTA